MVLRLQGVVAALRRTQDRLAAGVPPEERAAFLDEVGQTVRAIEEACAGYDATPQDLPSPSHRAYQDLRTIASLSPDALPDPASSRGGARAARPAEDRPPLKITQVVGTLNRTLEMLALAERGSEVVTMAADGVRQCTETVEEICRDASVTPSALPKRTARAYAMLKWLDQEGNLEHYLDRRDAAVAALRAAIQGLDRAGETARKIFARRPDLVVRFEPGRHVYRLLPEGRQLRLRLGTGFLGASDDDLRRVAEVAIRRSTPSDEEYVRYREFVDSEDFGAIEAELDLVLGGADYRARGRVYDLDRLFDRLDRHFFKGTLPRPHLDWYTSRSRVRFGYYVSARDLVRIDARLDDERVPEFVAECVLYHELLHKVHGAVHRGGRRHVHTAAFRADERRHPKHSEADMWLQRLVRRRFR